MMKKVKSVNRIFIMAAAILLAVCLGIGGGLLAHNFTSASGDTRAVSRVTPLELIERHGVDYVIGPIDEYSGESGYSGTYRTTEGVPTNNRYGIPASKYFDYKNYLYFEESSGEKVLRGWKNGIVAVDPLGSTGISENGYVTSGGVEDTTTVGIYFRGNSFAGNESFDKYMVIVPKEVTKVGKGIGSSDSTNAFTDFARWNRTSSWSPRERLIGVYFEDGSRLKEIEGGSMADSNYSPSVARQNDNKSAFETCNNMRFCVLPGNDGHLETIGRAAFANCHLLAELNVPTTVKTIGDYAFFRCQSLAHLSIPSSITSTINANAFNYTYKLADVEINTTRVATTAFPYALNIYGTLGGATASGKSQLVVVSTARNSDGEYDTGDSGFYFCRKTTDTTLRLATVTTGSNVNYQKNKWYMTGLAGKTDTSGATVYKLPYFVSRDLDEGATLDPRRENIAYDYLDSNGNAYKNELTYDIDSYEVGAYALKETWCRKIVLPSVVSVIGNEAFNYSHVEYLETHATTLGYRAFYNNDPRDTFSVDSEYYYLHSKVTAYGTNVFSGSSSGVTFKNGRYFILGDGNGTGSVYATHQAAATGGTGLFGVTNTTAEGTANHSVPAKEVYYQIPIVANVTSADGNVDIKESDMSTAFDNDADYTDNSYKKLNGVTYTGNEENQDGLYQITYTKRLSGKGFNVVKQWDGSWSTVGAVTSATLNNMTSTVWYNGSNEKLVSPWAAYSSASTTAINIYTHKFARPSFVDRTGDNAYTYGSTDFDSNGQIAFKKALFNDGTAVNSATDDYVINAPSFTYPTGNPLTGVTLSAIENAGTYVFSVNLNPNKWGTWEADYAKTFNTCTVVVNRQVLDISVDRLPGFRVVGGDDLHGDATTLYRYAEGWFPSQQGGVKEIATETVDNSYTYYSGNSISIEFKEEVPYNLNGTRNNSYTDSGEYFAYFEFYVKFIGSSNVETNYTFSFEGAVLSDNDKGLSIDNTSSTHFQLRKRWYIVTQTNMFIDSDYAGEINDSTPSYVLATDADGKAIYNWEYEESVTVHAPRLMYNVSYTDEAGNDATTSRPISPTIEIVYTPTTGSTVTIKTVDDDHELSYYINGAMPAGTYRVTMYGEKVRHQVEGGSFKTYEQISNTYTLTVSPKALDATKLSAIGTAMNGGESGNAYPLDGIQLHGDISTAVTALNDSLNTVRKTATASSSYWASSSADGYYQNAVVIAYNRKGSDNNVYVSYAAMLDLLGTANTYTLYYSVAATNYVTAIDPVGADDADRAYKFNTVLYTDMKLSDILDQFRDVNVPYFKDVVYTGYEAKTTVPYNRYYESSFDDDGYINVGRWSVTLTLNDPALAKWNNDLSKDEIGADLFARFEVNEDDASKLTVYFNINAAANGWNVMPQMSSWTFNSFDADVNAITAGLKFSGATVKYALIPNTVSDPNTAVGEWGITKDGAKVSGVDKATGVVYFTVGDGGATDDVTAAILNALKPANYYLKFFVSEIYAPDGETVNVKAYSDIARNDKNEPMTTVTVGKATNSWSSTPNVMRWTFGDYSSATHTITAVAVYPTMLPKDADGNDFADFAYTYTVDGVSQVLPKVKFVIYDSANNKIIEFTAGDDVSATLKALHAGTYVLATSMGGSDYYTVIAETRMNFEVGRAVNTWTTTPQVVQWTWGNYSPSVNVITAASKYYGGDGTEANADDKPILYSILKIENGVRVPVKITLPDGATMRAATEVTLENFVIKADGTFDDPTIAAAVAALPAGQFYLRATKLGNNDYTDITGGATTDIPFTIAQATNTWETTPGMTSWQYKAFTAENFRAGVPHYENTQSGITYTLTEKNGGEFTFGAGKVRSVVLTFTDGELDEIAAFKALHVGNYVIRAVQAETNDFGPLDYEVNFSVIKTANTWNPAPGMIGWTYGSFDSSYFTAGVPTLQESKNGDGSAAVVQYTLTKVGDASFTPVTFTAGYNFASLNAGSYAITATYAGTDDYDELSTDSAITFTVGKFVNGWNPAPVLRGWRYKSFTSTLFTAGVPMRQDDENAVVSYVVTGGKLATALTLTVTNGVLSADSVTALMGLAVGSYTLTVTYPKTDNYDELPATVTFDVTIIDNSWATRPSMRGWTYGAFDSSYFTAGVPTLKESKNGDGSAAVVQYTLTKVDDESFTAIAFTALSEVNFAALDAGDYKISVVYAGTTNYNELTAEIDFRVSPANNSWNKQPAITGFVYKQFSEANNFIAGVPHYPLESKTVYYVIGNSAFESVDTLEKFQAEGYAPAGSLYFTLVGTNGLDESVETYLKGLGCRTYYFAVFVPKGNNYSYLFYSGSFNVSQTGNNWVDGVSPDISGWTYGSFDEALFTSGTAEHGSVTYTVRKVVGDNVVETEDGIVKIGETSLSGISYGALKALLKDLGYGTYSLQATSGSTADYAEVKSSKQFTVAKADNEWNTNPSISGWTYDGTTTAAGNKGSAKYENAVISEKYYLTTTNSSGTLVPDLTKPVDAPVNAGSYAYVLTVKATANYNGFETTLFFIVEQAENGWETSPAGSYRWTWGDDITTHTANIVGAKAKNGAVTYSIVRTDGNYTAPTGLTIAELLEQLPVGEYAITVSVTPDNNYYAVAPAVAYVTVSAANLTVTDPACAGWTWGVANENKVFTDITVQTAKESDVASTEYRVSADGGVSWTDPITSYDGLMTYLRSSDRKADDYRVRISVTCANHESETRTVSFTIAKASFVWSGEQKNAAWDWNGNWTESDGGREIPAWSANDCLGNKVTLKYTVDGVSYADFDAVEAYLQSNTRLAETYTVKVVAELANHETAEKTFTVTVNVAENKWTQELDDLYSFEYLAWEKDDWTQIPMPTAKFGTVVCTYGATPITDIDAWIRGLSANNEAYVLRLSVPAVTKQYTELSKEVRIIVAGIGSVWSNQTDLLKVEGASATASVYNVMYDTGVFESLKETIVFPIGNATAGTTTYRVTSPDGETSSSYNVLSEFKAYFTSELKAGTYEIKAHYQPTNESYAPLDYTITVIVEKATVSWDEQLEQSYTKTYNSVDVPDPTVDKAFAAVTVIVKASGSDEALDMEGKTLSEFVKTLDVGSYTIIATIENSDNYTVQGVRETTSALYIGAIQNKWKDVTVDGKTITASEWTDGYTWTFTRGDTIAVVLPDFVIGELSIGFLGYTNITSLTELNNRIRLDENGNPRAAGTYSLRFSVEATPNYNGLVSNCTVVINKKSNDWTQPLESFTGSGSIGENEFTMPTAAVGSSETNDLRLFNIVKTGEPENSNWYTAANFLLELAKLSNGTFTITVRIGGSVPTSATDAFKKALEDYNADYNEITCSCYVTLSPAENDWTTKLSDMSWTFGDTVSATLSAATYGNNYIVYTISGNDREWTVRTSKYNEDIQNSTLDELNQVLGGLLPGTYTITASLVGTNLYAAPTENNYALLTVSKYSATWNDYTDEQLGTYALQHVTWNQVTNGFLPVLTVTYLDEYGRETESKESAIVWKIGNETLTESVIAALNKRPVGTYVITAMYEGDVRNESVTFTATVIIDAVQTAWDTATATKVAAAANLSWTYGIVPATNLPASFALANWTEGNSRITYAYVKGGVTTTIDDWSDFVDNLDKLDYGSYRVTATVAGDTNHTTLTATFLIDIARVETAWVNGDTLGDSTTLSWTYGKRAADATLPTLAIANWAEGKIAYSVTVDGVTSTIPDADWNAYLAKYPKLAIGTYTFTASVTGDGNHTDKVFTAIVTVEKAVVEWSENTDNADKQHSWVIDAETNSTLTQPMLVDAGDCSVTYTLVKVGATGTLYTGSVWSGENSLLSTLNAQKAGTYEITASASGNANYVLPASVTYTVTISAKPNSWDTQPASTVTWTYKSESNTKIEFVPAHNKDLLTITVGGKTVPASKLMDELGELGVGRYSIVASVGPNDEYAALDALTITLVVTKAKNNWVEGHALTLGDWTWNDSKTPADFGGFTAPVPQRGQSVVLSVMKDGDVMFTFTLGYTGEGAEKVVNENDVTVFKNRLYALDAGNYTVVADVAETSDYESLTTVVVSFQVKQAQNQFGANSPSIGGWNYGGDTIYPQTEATFGANTVVYAYAKCLDGETAYDESKKDRYVWQNSYFGNAGHYVLRATIPGTNNYKEIVGYCSFQIGLGQNDWTVEPKISAWKWGNYRADENLFIGASKSTGAVEFAIYKYGEQNKKVWLTENDFYAVPGAAAYDKTKIGLLGETKYISKAVSEEIANLLNALKPGQYVLHAYASSDDNYAAINKAIEFEIKSAENEWTEKAVVRGFVYGQPVETGDNRSFIAGVAKYGTVRYWLDDHDGEEDKFAADEVLGKLKTLGAGNHYLHAQVVAGAGTPYGDTVAVYVLFNVSNATNSWQEGAAPKTEALEKLYVEIQNASFGIAQFESWFGKPVPSEGTVKYTVLYNDLTTVSLNGASLANLDYNGLYAAIKGSEEKKALSAGEYIIRLDAVEDNYDTLTASVSLSITRMANSFKLDLTENLVGVWETGNRTALNASSLNRLNAEEGLSAFGSVTFIVDNNPYSSVGALVDYVGTLNAGSKIVTLSVKQENEYEGLTGTIQLDIMPADNAWLDWSESGCFELPTALSRGTGAAWVWKSSVNWKNPKPKYGSLVYVEIRRADDESNAALYYVTVDYDLDEVKLNKSIGIISDALSKLDKGEYIITVSAPADNNWRALRSNEIAFEVTQASNRWTTNPYITVGQGSASVTSWTYGEVPVLHATALHEEYGAPEYKFYNGVYTGVGDGNVLSSMPTAAGTYTVEFFLSEPDNANYAAIPAYRITFVIEPKNETGFEENPGATGWIWNEYKRVPTEKDAANLFTGVPRSGGIVSYAVCDKDGNVVVAYDSKGKAVRLEGIKLVDFAGVRHDDPRQDIYVPKDYEEALKLLPAGEYRLRVSVSATDNYMAFSNSDTRFTVTEATNVWTKTPQIANWSQGEFAESVNMPVAISKYGKVSITIVGDADNYVYYKIVDGDISTLKNELSDAPVGWYTMTATATGEQDKYDSLRESIRFQIFLRGSVEQVNYWEEEPAITGWEANTNKQYNAPTGVPARGVTRFVFYHSIELGRDNYVIDYDHPVTESEGIAVTSGGKYPFTYYVPQAPGHYFMAAYAEYRDPYGTIIEKDSIPVNPREFIIRSRENSFLSEPHVDSVLYLGQRGEWADPTADAYLPDTTITFTYYDMDGNNLGSEKPKAAGTYRLRTTLSATYSDDVVKDIEFVVELSTMTWESAPYIKDWSEENGPNLPVGGQSSLGNDKIVYTYYDRNDPNKTILTEAPTKEGSYTMIATIEMEGYKPLTATYDFTIEPAFDRDLVTIDIILGTVATALAVVVVVFAIKRYKEN